VAEVPEAYRLILKRSGVDVQVPFGIEDESMRLIDK